MPACTRPGFNAVAARRRPTQPRAEERDAKLGGDALAMRRPVVSLRLQAMVDVEGSDPGAIGRAGGGMQQGRGIKAAAEGDRNGLSGSWCR
jgi:hypothetical protein